MKKILLFAFLVLIAGCTVVKSISEIKNEEFVGETVSVRGEVVERLALGDLSGFTIKDRYNDTIFISSEELPAQGDTISVSGTLEESIFGYYIDNN